MLRSRVSINRWRSWASVSTLVPPVMAEVLVTIDDPIAFDWLVIESGGTFPAVPTVVHWTGMET
jgi:hypothetical protein